MSIDDNKQVVLRFNKEFLESGNTEVLREIVADDFTNHTAAAGVADDISGLVQFVGLLHKAFSGMHIDIHEQVGENDVVATRKTIHAIHTGEIMGHAATGKAVEMNVIDIVRLRNGKYVDHWGRNDIMQVIQAL